MAPNSFCPFCNNAIDTEVCWCGSGQDDPEHTMLFAYTHSFVPMGCTCGYHIQPENDWEKLLHD